MGFGQYGTHVVGGAKRMTMAEQCGHTLDSLWHGLWALPADPLLAARVIEAQATDIMFFDGVSTEEAHEQLVRCKQALTEVVNAG